MSDPQPRRRGRWWVRRWHRWLGAVFALPLLWLCITGLLLQHRDTFGLQDRKVSSEWLLKRYGQIPEGDPKGVKAGRFEVSEWNEVLFLDEKVLDESGVLVGAVAKPAEVVLATRQGLFVYDAQGAYLDRLGEESLPGVPVERIGLRGASEVMIEVGGKMFRIDDSFLDYSEVEADEEVSWSEVSVASAARSRLQGVLAEGAGFTWDRVITDLHSGSLFGSFGKFLVDLTGIAVMVLTLMGLRLLFRRRATGS